MPGAQGISAGCADVSGQDLPGQWIDLGEHALPEGDYVLRAVFDPANLIQESPDRAGPVTVTRIHGGLRRCARGRVVTGRFTDTKGPVPGSPRPSTTSQ